MDPARRAGDWSFAAFGVATTPGRLAALIRGTEPGHRAPRSLAADLVVDSRGLPARRRLRSPVEQRRVSSVHPRERCPATGRAPSHLVLVVGTGLRRQHPDEIQAPRMVRGRVPRRRRELVHAVVEPRAADDAVLAVALPRGGASEEGVVVMRIGARRSRRRRDGDLRRGCGGRFPRTARRHGLGPLGLGLAAAAAAAACCPRAAAAASRSAWARRPPSCCSSAARWLPSWSTTEACAVRRPSSSWRFFVRSMDRGLVVVDRLLALRVSPAIEQLGPRAESSASVLLSTGPKSEPEPL